MNEFDYLAKACKKMEDEKYNEVIFLCEKALKINENLPDAYDYSGDAKFYLGEYDSAVDYYTKAIDLNPNDPEYFYDRSWAYKQLNELENAIVDANKAIALDKRPYYCYHKARLELDMHRNKEAIEDFTEQLSLDEDMWGYIYRGNAYMNLEMFDYAMADLNTAVVKYPDKCASYYHRGCLKMQTERYDSAIKDFKKSLEIYDGNDEACVKIGFCMIEIGKNGAMKYFNEAIKINPCIENYIARIIARRKVFQRRFILEKLSHNISYDYCDDNFQVFSEKQANSDIRDLKKMISLEPDEPFHYAILASRYRYLNDYEKAVKNFSKALEFLPEKDYFYSMRAFCYEKLGQYQQAILDCDKYCEINNGFVNDDVSNTYGLANYKLGNYIEALNYFSQSLDIKFNAEICYLKGLVNCQLRNYFEAYNDFAKAIKFEPEIESKMDEKIPFLIGMILAFRDGFNKDEKIPQKRNGSPIGLNGIK